MNKFPCCSFSRIMSKYPMKNGPFAEKKEKEKRKRELFVEFMIRLHHGQFTSVLRWMANGFSPFFLDSCDIDARGNISDNYKQDDGRLCDQHLAADICIVPCENTGHTIVRIDGELTNLINLLQIQKSNIVTPCVLA